MTLDVTRLYTNIPNLEGKLAMAKALQLHRHPNSNPTNQGLLTLLNLVLTCNTFTFNQKNYLQVGGTAMGTKLAPSLANIFMGHFEEKHVYSYHPQPLIWLRFIDNIFTIWTHGQTEFQTFLDHLNSCHKTIKFTVDVSPTGHGHMLTRQLLTRQLLTRQLLTPLVGCLVT